MKQHILISLSVTEEKLLVSMTPSIHCMHIKLIMLGPLWGLDPQIDKRWVASGQRCALMRQLGMASYGRCHTLATGGNNKMYCNRAC